MTKQKDWITAFQSDHCKDLIFAHWEIKTRKISPCKKYQKRVGSHNTMTKTCISCQTIQFFCANNSYPDTIQCIDIPLFWHCFCFYISCLVIIASPLCPVSIPDNNKVRSKQQCYLRCWNSNPDLCIMPIAIKALIYSDKLHFIVIMSRLVDQSFLTCLSFLLNSLMLIQVNYTEIV